MPLWPALKEENMKGLQRYVRLLICAVLALCSTTQEAMAQAVTVAPYGAGEHLLFTYWSTAAGTHTNVNIHSPLGLRAAHTAEAQNVVHVRVRSAAADRNVVVAFNICLRPGDSWTATLSAAGLQVGSAGGCDDQVQAPAPSRRVGGNHPTPAPGESVSLAHTERGYLEAWLNPTGTLTDDAVWPPDADYGPDHATPRYITGLAMVVSPASGFSSSYDAIALRGCGATAGTPIAADTDDGNGCWALGTGGSGGTSPVAGTDGGVWIRQALRGVTTAPTPTDSEPAPAPGDTPRDLLLGRWTAIADAHVTSSTTVVLTLPVNHLLLADRSADPVSVYVYDDDGTLVLRSIDLTLPLGVNLCRFLPPTGAQPVMLSCNGEAVGAIEAAAGEFRIFNNTAVGWEETAVQIRERPGLTHTDGGAQDPAESLGVLGLVFSYFEGTDGLQYDQATPVRSVEIPDDASNL